MPSVGQGNEKVSFPYDAEGIKAAEKYAQAVGGQVGYSEQSSDMPGMRSNISLGYEEGGKVPEMNAMNRSEKTYMGGGKTGYNVMDKYAMKSPINYKGSELMGGGRDSQWGCGTGPENEPPAEIIWKKGGKVKKK